MLIFAVVYLGLFLVCQRSIRQTLFDLKFYEHYYGWKTNPYFRATIKLLFCAGAFLAAVYSESIFKTAILVILPLYLLVNVAEVKSEDTKIAIQAKKYKSQRHPEYRFSNYELAAIQLFSAYLTACFFSLLVVLLGTSLAYEMAKGSESDPKEMALGYLAIVGGVLGLGSLLTVILNYRTYKVAKKHILDIMKREGA
jgi:hypothetical protein